MVFLIFKDFQLIQNPGFPSFIQWEGHLHFQFSSIDGIDDNDKKYITEINLQNLPKWHRNLYLQQSQS